MTKNTKKAGDARELKVRHVLEDDGYKVRKAKMSFGPADLYAVHEETKERFLIQVKANKGSPWLNFRREERRKLAEEAQLAGAQAILIHWPPHGTMDVYPERSWPLTPGLTNL